MTNKEVLRKYYRLHLEINRLRDQIDDLKKLSTSISSPSNIKQDVVKVSLPSQSAYEDLVLKWVMIEKELYVKIDDLLSKQKEIENIIDHVKNPIGRTLLKYRYINGYEFQDIAKKMNYSLSHTYLLHSRFLSQL